MSLSLMITCSYRASRSICTRLLTLPEVPSRSRHSTSRIAHVGKLRPQPLDLANSRIVQAAHAEDNLKVARILLPAMAHQTRIHARIDTLHRLQDRDIRRKSALELLPPPVMREAPAPHNASSR